MTPIIILAENEEGTSEPVAICTREESEQLIREDYDRRLKLVDAEESPLCPFQYTLWEQGRFGYELVQTTLAENVYDILNQNSN